jgi:cell division protein FtsI (penicillin-binding protein 3)
MEAVVERGTATRAKVPGYTVAGKTGTADKLVNGRYSPSQENVSFVGFAPSRNPALAIIVMIDSPRAGADTGGVVAAPIFQRIAEDSLRHLGVPPNVNPQPPVLVTRPRNVTAPVSPAPRPMRVSVVEGAAVLPDLSGLGAREAIHELARLGLTPRVRGAGVVVAQQPAPGTPLEPGAISTVVLGREPRPVAATGVSQP